MARRGRPANSQVRQNIVEILYFAGSGHGYEISRKYIKVFPKVTMRLIYYHLNKGTEMGVFSVEKVKRETGDFSWGSTAEKVYYKLGPNAKPKADFRVKQMLEK